MNTNTQRRFPLSRVVKEVRAADLQFPVNTLKWGVTREFQDVQRQVVECIRSAIDEIAEEQDWQLSEAMKKLITFRVCYAFMIPNFMNHLCASVPFKVRSKHTKSKNFETLLDKNLAAFEDSIQTAVIPFDHKSDPQINGFFEIAVDVLRSNSSFEMSFFPGRPNPITEVRKFLRSGVLTAAHQMKNLSMQVAIQRGKHGKIDNNQLSADFNDPAVRRSYGHLSMLNVHQIQPSNPREYLTEGEYHQYAPISLSEGGVWTFTGKLRTPNGSVSTGCPAHQNMGEGVRNTYRMYDHLRPGVQECVRRATTFPTTA